ncbi:MAG: molecular chaperone HtpG, partial [Turicibacter sp.]|nr:molecular chaperone HtpG [Turicibacter sp.]
GLDTDAQDEEATKEFATLFETMTSALSGKVKSVRASRRLKSHPVCLANEGDLSIEMEKVLNSMPNRQQVKSEKVLEVNENHEVFKSLQTAYEQDQEKFNLFTDVLYNKSRLIEGLDIEDPVAFTNNVCKLMK